mmetsp:Transcript_90444/g.160178  ORF Transcript_90444/g.160178 Transcript_90444/m.160178 type:complete len:558 (+) Transcript_90444:94-1767(+)
MLDAEEALNLSLDDIIERDESGKNRRRGQKGGTKEGGKSHADRKGGGGNSEKSKAEERPAGSHTKAEPVKAPEGDNDPVEKLLDMSLDDVINVNEEKLKHKAVRKKGKGKGDSKEANVGKGGDAGNPSGKATRIGESGTDLKPLKPTWKIWGGSKRKVAFVNDDQEWEASPIGSKTKAKPRQSDWSEQGGSQKWSATDKNSSGSDAWNSWGSKDAGGAGKKTTWNFKPAKKTEDSWSNSGKDDSWDSYKKDDSWKKYGGGKSWKDSDGSKDDWNSKGDSWKKSAGDDSWRDQGTYSKDKWSSSKADSWGESWEKPQKKASNSSSWDESKQWRDSKSTSWDDSNEWRDKEKWREKENSSRYVWKEKSDRSGAWDDQNASSSSWKDKGSSASSWTDTKHNAGKWSQREKRDRSDWSGGGSDRDIRDVRREVRNDADHWTNPKPRVSHEDAKPSTDTWQRKNRSRVIEDIKNYEPPQKRARNNEERRARNRIVVKNIPSDLSWKDIKDAFEFESVGSVTFCELDRNEARIEFQREADARQAVETFDSGELNGRRISVHLV